MQPEALENVYSYTCSIQEEDSSQAAGQLLVEAAEAPIWCQNGRKNLSWWFVRAQIGWYFGEHPSHPPLSFPTFGNSVRFDNTYSYTTYSVVRWSTQSMLGWGFYFDPGVFRWLDQDLKICMIVSISSHLLFEDSRKHVARLEKACQSPWLWSGKRPGPEPSQRSREILLGLCAAELTLVAGEILNSRETHNAQLQFPGTRQQDLKSLSSTF